MPLSVVAALTGVAYLGLLFAVAHYGDTSRRLGLASHRRPYIYALSLGVYCTSWTFFGSVGSASTRGLDFLAIYVGPMLLYLAAQPLIRRVVRVAKAERITSVADFVAARYGKNQIVAVVVTGIATVSVIPYIALQLKAVSFSVVILSGGSDTVAAGLPVADVSLVIAIAMATFACLFGTRHVDATEHQEGLMLAIAAESVVKLVTFLIVGLYVTFHLFGGPADMFARASDNPLARAAFTRDLGGGSWLASVLLSFLAVLLLPRMFHVTVVENNAPRELATARWLFPGYLVAINLFVVPIAVAGLLLLPPQADADSFVLRLPLAYGDDWITMIAFVGGLSAATAMVILASVALAVMMCNELVVPIILRRSEAAERVDLARSLLIIRRVAIFVILIAAYVYFRLLAGRTALADIGLVSFAAIAQIAPACLGGLFWRRATARGAIAGMLSGFSVWAYTLLLPAFVKAGFLPEDIILNGPFGFWPLRPQALFSLAFEPLPHGVFWSLCANVAAFVFWSLTRQPEPIERVQASIFVHPERVAPFVAHRWQTSVTVDDLTDTVARYLGPERTRLAFAGHWAERGLRPAGDQTADADVMRFAEQQLASAIGAASSRLVLSLLVKRRDPSTKATMRLLDEASSAIQYNRDLLQTAIDQVAQGISVFDRNLNLLCWNTTFSALLQLPAEVMQVGTPLTTMLRDRIETGAFGPGKSERLTRFWVDRLVEGRAPFQQRLASSAAVVEISTRPMPDGGIVVTWTDITERVAAAEALQRVNETLERRVRERTEELTRLNDALRQAKGDAEAANSEKTRFLAAAGHDIAQPLNAARLYVTSLMERAGGTPLADMAENIGHSLDAVEDVIGALLDISRLDSGQIKPDVDVFRLDGLLRQLGVEFRPIAAARGLTLDIVLSGLSVRSDMRLLRRLLENLISNAIKYTLKGRVLIGCRRRGTTVRIDVCDTGLGIPSSQQREIFREFQRLEQGARVARGLGLGLSIVERIATVLDVTVTLRSVPGRGSVFSVTLPLAPPVPAPETGGDRSPVAAGPLHDCLVVAIDNEPSILDAMRGLLIGWGCEVIACANAHAAAVEVARLGRTPDALLVDYHLDDGNGLDAAATLRWRFGQGIPAVLVTADRSPALREAAQSRGIAILNKPVRPAALRAVISQARLTTGESRSVLAENLDQRRPHDDNEEDG